MRRRGGLRATRHLASTDEDLDYKPKVTRRKIGVWDVVTARPRVVDWLPGLPTLQWPSSTPYLKRFLRDLLCISPSWFIIWAIGNALNSVIPAASLYWSSQLLLVIQRAVDGAQVSEQDLLQIACARLLCTVLGKLLPYLLDTVCTSRLNSKIRSFFEEHLLYAHLRLDNVTFSDPKVQHELSLVSPTTYNSAWRAVSESVRIASLGAQLLSQLSVLGSILRQHNEGAIYLLLTMATPALQWISRNRRARWSADFYAVADNALYLRFLGYQELAYKSAYREEVVMYNLQSFLLDKAREMKGHLGDAALAFNEAIRTFQQQSSLGLIGQISAEVSRDIPQILFAFSSLRSPTISLSLTWLALLRETVSSISDKITTLATTTQSMEEHFDCIRILYSCAEIKNQVTDGNSAYSSIANNPSGMSLEFREVQFKYPTSAKPALAGVSFIIEPGQLCVIVGRNGSGKSSIIKLISRLYDCTEGAILVNGQPIQQFNLESYRQCLSTLPQEFSFFPLSVAENIGLGDAKYADNDERIRRAADLGGALDFIEHDLAEGFETRLKGPSTLHMHTSDRRFAQWANKEVQKHREASLSGGQWQRLALSRTFMRSSDITRLLCYDEPSAALDPLAEYDLFQRLCKLRGCKTMVFVTHRFGHLTRQADKIIVLGDGHIIEQGTHAELLANGGEYARMYNLQAMAFSAI